MTDRLTSEACRTLALHGISATAWLGAHPGGDACGCSDDRCIGFHHEAGDECLCLPVLIDEYRVTAAGGAA